MLVKVNIPLKTLDGQVMKDNDGQGNAVDATIRSAIVNAVLAPVQKETGVEKIKKYELAKKVFENDEVDLNEDEIKIIKDVVGELFSPIVVGQVFELLKV